MNETVTFLLKAKSAHVEVLHDKFQFRLPERGGWVNDVHLDRNHKFICTPSKLYITQLFLAFCFALRAPPCIDRDLNPLFWCHLSVFDRDRLSEF